jgi:hypothetical protein
MDSEKQFDQSEEGENSGEDASSLDEHKAREFVEPLKELEGESVDSNENRESEEDDEIETDPTKPEASDVEQTSEDELDTDSHPEDKESDEVEAAPEEKQSAAVESGDSPEEAEGDLPEITASMAEATAEDEDPKAGGETAATNPKPENYAETASSDVYESDPSADLDDAGSDDGVILDDDDFDDEQDDSESNHNDLNESNEAASIADNKTEKFKNLSKLALSICIIFVLIAVVLAYSKKWPFHAKNDKALQSTPVNKPVAAESSIKKSKARKPDPYRQYRNLLNEAKNLRNAIRLKQQEVTELKEHYAEAIKGLEYDILQEILSAKIENYQMALKNTRVNLGMHAIQRRQAYIHKLEEPMNWLKQGSEELLYLRRRALFDLQVIDIADGVDMDRHARHISAGIQKYLLTAENLAIDPEGGKAEPLQPIWKRLYTEVKNNPKLPEQLHNWYIQQEVCNGDVSRLRELEEISVDTAICVSESTGSDIFLNNISVLSPSIAQYLCRWNGKWICLNGLQALSPATAQYLFRWEGECLSLNGLSEFPSDLAKHLEHWKGKQLELMGLKYDKNRTDRLALSDLAEWEKAGGKLMVSDQIREMLNRL